ncbi:MAG: acetylxylan esterase [Planctomycetaceae bacterium]|nr:acetylxylan esterase [Planctomycetaceae bacterium]
MSNPIDRSTLRPANPDSMNTVEQTFVTQAGGIPDGRVRAKSASSRRCQAWLAGGIVMLMVGFSDSADAQPTGFNYDETKVPSFELPDVLTTAAGEPVTTTQQWKEVRRPEILHLFEEHVFGTLPKNAVRLRVRERSSVNNAVNGKALRRELIVSFSDDDNGPAMEILIYTPVHAPGPVPCFLALNFNGNHSIEADPSIHLSESWMREDAKRGNINHRATEATRGSAASRWPVEMIIDRGYGLATIYYGDIDPDFDDGFQNGIHAMLEQNPQQRPANAGGSISAWSWGLSRALDILELDAKVDGRKVAVMGHSRLGKTSLWAGATDERFAMVISNDSGCGGAALSRRCFGETVRRINTSFPHWFCRNHRQYNDNENALPVDHHMLLALMAPRPVYVASAEEDQWADPRGEMLSLYYATPVFELFGKKGLSSDQLPPVNEPIQTDVGYHIRTGKHDVTDFDWTQYLNFADRHLKE